MRFPSSTVEFLRLRLCAGGLNNNNNNNKLLEVFDSTLRAGLSTVLNVDLNDDQWLQASLPVGEGGLGIRVLRCWHLPPFGHQRHRHSLFSNPFSPTA